MLSGLGVPDVSGRIGRPAYFTSDPFFAPREGNDFSVEIVRLESNVGRQQVRVLGPPGRAFGRDGHDRLLADADGPRRRATGSSSRPETRAPSSRSGSGATGSRSSSASTRSSRSTATRACACESVQPEIGLYLSPVQFDPAHLPPGFTISSPRGFAEELVREFGRYKTMGWAIDTWSIQSGTLPEDAFLEDVKMTAEQERKMLRGMLARQGPPPLPLLRVPGPRRPRLLALPRPGAPRLRREAGGEIRRRRSRSPTPSWTRSWGRRRSRSGRRTC